MYKTDKEHIDTIIRNKLQEEQFAYKEGAWEKFQAEMGSAISTPPSPASPVTTTATRAVNSIKYWLNGGLISVLIASALLSVLFFSNSGKVDTNPIISSTNNINPPTNSYAVPVFTLPANNPKSNRVLIAEKPEINDPVYAEDLGIVEDVEEIKIEEIKNVNTETEAVKAEDNDTDEIDDSYPIENDVHKNMGAPVGYEDRIPYTPTDAFVSSYFLYNKMQFWKNPEITGASRSSIVHFDYLQSGLNISDDNFRKQDIFLGYDFSPKDNFGIGAWVSSVNNRFFPGTKSIGIGISGSQEFIIDEHESINAGIGLEFAGNEFRYNSVFNDTSIANPLSKSSLGVHAGIRYTNRNIYGVLAVRNLNEPIRIESEELNLSLKSDRVISIGVGYVNKITENVIMQAEVEVESIQDDINIHPEVNFAIKQNYLLGLELQHLNRPTLNVGACISDVILIQGSASVDLSPISNVSPYSAGVKIKIRLGSNEAVSQTPPIGG